jgi:hypothetical protein
MDQCTVLERCIGRQRVVVVLRCLEDDGSPRFEHRSYYCGCEKGTKELHSVCLEKKEEDCSE